LLKSVAFSGITKLYSKIDTSNYELIQAIYHIIRIFVYNIFKFTEKIANELWLFANNQVSLKASTAVLEDNKGKAPTYLHISIYQII